MIKGSGQSTRSRLRRLLIWLGSGLAACAIVSLLVVGLLRWLDPPTSAFMLRQWVAGQFSGEPPPHVYHEWVD
ncbi:MAG: monofunctional biosynthetic peptidoglycan transglycosylase, partial [Thiohalocapsa sp.]